MSFAFFNSLNSNSGMTLNAAIFLDTVPREIKTPSTRSCLIAARLILLRLPLPTGLLKKRYIIFWDEETVLHLPNQVIVLGLQ